MIKYGYLPSKGYYHGLNIPQFFKSPTVMALGANSNPDGHIIPETYPAYDQLSLSSCTANATCMAYAILEFLNNPATVKDLSRLFLYYNGRVPANLQNQDDGTYVHLVVNSLQTLGVCLESAWNYVEADVNFQPNILAYKQANDNKISSFYQISSSGQDRVADVCAAIKANHPVIFGTQVGGSLENYNGDPSKVFDIPTTTDIASGGGHAITIVGFRTNSQGRKEFCIKNSWGPFWGTSNGLSSMKGYFWMSENYLTWDQTSDLFVISQYQNLLI